MSGPTVVVNADDFGLSPGVNEGILHAHEHGLVTSTSLMVRRPAAAAATSAARSRPLLSIGLHLDLGEWVYRNGRWSVAYEVADLQDAAAVERAVDEQLERFRSLVGRNPTHLDSHQHVHREEPVASVMRALALELGVPLRSTELGPAYIGEFYGQSGKGEPYPEGISAAALVAIIERLPDGAYELGCHPGRGNDSGSSYGEERERELAALCSAEAAEAVARRGVRLASFAEVVS